jgi:hypothetical protein
MLAPLIAALPASFASDPARAIDPNETQVTLPDQFQWKSALPSAPAQSIETVPVFGATDKPGPYVVLIKWYPGYMSADGVGSWADNVGFASLDAAKHSAS